MRSPSCPIQCLTQCLTRCCEVGPLSICVKGFLSLGANQSINQSVVSSFWLCLCPALSSTSYTHTTVNRKATERLVSCGVPEPDLATPFSPPLSPPLLSPPPALPCVVLLFAASPWARCVSVVGELACDYMWFSFVSSCVFFSYLFLK